MRVSKLKSATTSDSIQASSMQVESFYWHITNSFQSSTWSRISGPSTYPLMTMSSRYSETKLYSPRRRRKTQINQILTLAFLLAIKYSNSWNCCQWVKLSKFLKQFSCLVQSLTLRWTSRTTLAFTSLRRISGKAVYLELIVVLI